MFSEVEKHLALFTDLYELTMAKCYKKFRNVIATFELFVRRLPKNRGYLLIAGIQDVCTFLQNFRFRKEDLSFLETLGFGKEFLHFLRKLRFSGEVWCMDEGEVAFPHEPIVRVRAPIIEAQLLETFLINAVNFQSLIATKASRVVIAARGRKVVDFGSRRAHGTEAALNAARACYLGGCDGTSNVLAGKLYGIPVFGTMAHSFVQSFESEEKAFEAWLRCWGERTILLIDTYDTVRGAEIAARVVKKLGLKNLGGVRIDSGDLLSLSKEVRKVLDGNGLKFARIFASGGLDEYRIEELLKKKAPIDGFGVGTSLVTSDDSPGMDTCYKLVEVEVDGERIPTMKLAEGEKATWPCAKQVFRFERNGKFRYDTVALDDETLEGKALLHCYFKRGRLVRKPLSLEEAREYALENLKKLPERYKRIISPPKYKVKFSQKLKRVRQNLMRELKARILG